MGAGPRHPAHPPSRHHRSLTRPPHARHRSRCLQLLGGYGYMLEYPIARLYAGARVHKIYGGTNEIMEELISRTL